MIFFSLFSTVGDEDSGTIVFAGVQNKDNGPNGEFALELTPPATEE
jgi:hypothetical protein